MNLDVGVPDDLLDRAGTAPDLSRLRDFAAEFELRAVIQRLEEEYEGAVPDRAVDETIELEATEGSPADLAEGPTALAIVGGRFAATDGAKVVTATPADLVALARRPRRSPARRATTSRRWAAGRATGCWPRRARTRSRSTTTR